MQLHFALEIRQFPEHRPTGAARHSTEGLSLFSLHPQNLLQWQNLLWAFLRSNRMSWISSVEHLQMKLQIDNRQTKSPLGPWIISSRRMGDFACKKKKKKEGGKPLHTGNTQDLYFLKYMLYAYSTTRNPNNRQRTAEEPLRFYTAPHNPTNRKCKKKKKVQRFKQEGKTQCFSRRLWTGCKVCRLVI